MKCRRCKCKIESGVYCKDCYEKNKQNTLKKIENKRLSKMQSSIEYQISQIKEVADPVCWCSTHSNCFRASVQRTNETKNHKCESIEHINKKFERWLFHRRLGRTVFTELRLKKGLGRPDLIIISEGFVFIEEIVCSEREISLIKKKGKYPWPINIIHVKDGEDLE